mmetsp:Transcript_2958/g.4100  ORF Transcript_2958/g.4100 Transcript_2958/m.4100 type:complete len:1778 (+) Transcript_2958:645-5978(+)
MGIHDTLQLEHQSLQFHHYPDTDSKDSEGKTKYGYYDPRVDIKPGDVMYYYLCHSIRGTVRNRYDRGSLYSVNTWQSIRTDKPLYDKDVMDDIYQREQNEAMEKLMKDLLVTALGYVPGIGTFASLAISAIDTLILDPYFEKLESSRTNSGAQLANGKHDVLFSFEGAQITGVEFNPINHGTKLGKDALMSKIKNQLAALEAFDQTVQRQEHSRNFHEMQMHPASQPAKVNWVKWATDELQADLEGRVEDKIKDSFKKGKGWGRRAVKAKIRSVNRNMSKHSSRLAVKYANAKEVRAVKRTGTQMNFLIEKHLSRKQFEDVASLRNRVHKMVQNNVRRSAGGSGAASSSGSARTTTAPTSGSASGSALRGARGRLGARKLVDSVTDDVVADYQAVLSDRGTSAQGPLAASKSWKSGLQRSGSLNQIRSRTSMSSAVKDRLSRKQAVVSSKLQLDLPTGTGQWLNRKANRLFREQVKDGRWPSSLTAKQKRISYLEANKLTFSSSKQAEARAELIALRSDVKRIQTKTQFSEPAAVSNARAVQKTQAISVSAKKVVSKGGGKLNRQVAQYVNKKAQNTVSRVAATNTVLSNTARKASNAAMKALDIFGKVQDLFDSIVSIVQTVDFVEKENEVLANKAYHTCAATPLTKYMVSFSPNDPQFNAWRNTMQEKTPYDTRDSENARGAAFRHYLPINFRGLMYSRFLSNVPVDIDSQEISRVYDLSDGSFTGGNGYALFAEYSSGFDPETQTYSFVGHVSVERLHLVVTLKDPEEFADQTWDYDYFKGRVHSFYDSTSQPKQDSDVALPDYQQPYRGGHNPHSYFRASTANPGKAGFRQWVRTHLSTLQRVIRAIQKFKRKYPVSQVTLCGNNVAGGFALEVARRLEQTPRSVSGLQKGERVEVVTFGAVFWDSQKQLQGWQPYGRVYMFPWETRTLNLGFEDTAGTMTGNKRYERRSVHNLGCRSTEECLGSDAVTLLLPRMVPFGECYVHPDLVTDDQANPQRYREKGQPIPRVFVPEFREGYQFFLYDDYDDQSAGLLTESGGSASARGKFKFKGNTEAFINSCFAAQANVLAVKPDVSHIENYIKDELEVWETTLAVLTLGGSAKVEEATGQSLAGEMMPWDINLLDTTLTDAQKKKKTAEKIELMGLQSVTPAAGQKGFYSSKNVAAQEILFLRRQDRAEERGKGAEWAHRMGPRRRLQFAENYKGSDWQEVKQSTYYRPIYDVKRSHVVKSYVPGFMGTDFFTCGKDKMFPRPCVRLGNYEPTYLYRRGGSEPVFREEDHRYVAMHSKDRYAGYAVPKKKLTTFKQNQLGQKLNKFHGLLDYVGTSVLDPLQSTFVQTQTSEGYGELLQQPPDLPVTPMPDPFLFLRTVFQNNNARTNLFFPVVQFTGTSASLEGFRIKWYWEEQVHTQAVQLSLEHSPLRVPAQSVLLDPHLRLKVSSSATGVRMPAPRDSVQVLRDAQTILGYGPFGDVLFDLASQQVFNSMTTEEVDVQYFCLHDPNGKLNPSTKFWRFSPSLGYHFAERDGSGSVTTAATSLGNAAVPSELQRDRDGRMEATPFGAERLFSGQSAGFFVSTSSANANKTTVLNKFRIRGDYVEFDLNYSYQAEGKHYLSQLHMYIKDEDKDFRPKGLAVFGDLLPHFCPFEVKKSWRCLYFSSDLEVAPGWSTPDLNGGYWKLSLPIPADLAYNFKRYRLVVPGNRPIVDSGTEVLFGGIQLEFKKVPVPMLYTWRTQRTAALEVRDAIVSALLSYKYLPQRPSEPSDGNKGDEYMTEASE